MLSVNTTHGKYATTIQKFVRRMLALMGLEDQLAPTAMRYRGRIPDSNIVYLFGKQFDVSRLWMSLVYRNIEGRREAYASVQHKDRWYMPRGYN